MACTISASVIKNLDHELDEIRVRALKHVEGKILRAFEQKSSIEMCSGKLVSKLINWFNKKPLLEVETVLNLILSIFKSEKIHEIIKFLKKPILEKEINKINEIVKTSVLYKEIIQNIKTILENYEEYDDCNETSSVSLPVSISSSDNISIHDLNLENDEFSNEYEAVWSTPSLPDLNQINMIFNSTSTTSTFAEIKNGLIFFKTAVNDYPTEYFLQPPYIFKNMIKLYFKEKSFAKLLISNFTYLCVALLSRAKKRVLSECYDPTWKENMSINHKTQITIPKFCVEILKVCVEHLKEFISDIDQNEIFCVYQLIMVVFDIMKLDEYKKYENVISLKSILIDLGMLARFYRQEEKYRIYRIQYILIISVIAKFVQEGNFSIKSDKNVYSCYRESTADIKFYEIWHLELQNAIFDFPMKYHFPMIYNEVEKAISDTVKEPHVQAVLNCNEKFASAIEILKKHEVKSDTEFILLGLKALDTLSIHISLTFVQKLIKTISHSIYLFDGNSNLKLASEEVMLRLLAHENINVQRITYKQISNNIKQSFGSLMNGNINTRNLGSYSNCSQSLGIPFTTEIISEIICFGYCHEDISIRKNSEIILSLILKGRELLGTNWTNILQVLIPNFPLLQSLANYEDNLGKLILELFNPDNGLELYELLKGNIRFLFSTDYKIRSEAISRLAYILIENGTNDKFLPNIREIFDIIPDNLCLMQVPRDPEKIFYGGLYDCTTIPALLELLKSDDVEPNVRKTCLMQLNVLCQDIDLNKMIFKENGWFYSMQALENSLKKNPSADYPDSVIPAVGILSKILLCNSFFRTELSNEIHIYELLLRALFLYYNDITLQQDAIITLFLLLYNHHIIGGEKQISLPAILKKINLPLKCEFHWKESCFKQVNFFEELYLQLYTNSGAELNQSVCSKTLSNTTNFERERFSSIPLSRRSEPAYSVIRDKESNEKNIMLQFIRLSFATLWFTDFNIFYKNILSGNTKNDKFTLDYSNVPDNVKENSNGIIKNSDILEFNTNLKINKEDIKFIKNTSPQENLKVFFKKITNATTEKDFLKNLAELRFCLFLGAYNILDGNEATKNFQRILTVKPNSCGDYNVFLNIIELFDYLLRLKNEAVIFWTLKEFNEQHCTILQMLKDFNAPSILYDSICKFVETLIKTCSAKGDNNKIQEIIYYKNESNFEKKFLNLYNKLFEYIIPITEECFHKRYLDQVRSLLNLLQIITETQNLEIDYGFVNIVIKKMMYFVMALKLFTQSGSHINKNCLLIVGNLMSTCDEIILDENQIKLLSGLCSHEDFEIRALSWSILTKIALNLRGAHLIVKELSYLPGGFHACCLSTLLDENEIPVVRFTAGMLFANLLSHKITDSNGASLHISVAPLCIELDPSQNNNGIDLVAKIFSKYKFYSAILNSIEHVHIGRRVNSLKIQNITTCCIINAYCRILSNFISLCSNSTIADFDNEPFIIRIFNIIKLVPSCVTDESLWMLSEICFLINKFYSYENIEIIKKNICSDYGFIVALIQLLNFHFFEKRNPDLLQNILQTLTLLLNNTISFEIISETLSNTGASNLIEIIVYGLTNTKNIDLQNVCLALVITLLAKSDNVSTDRYKTISTIFESTNLIKPNLAICGNEQIFYSLSSLFKNFCQKLKEGDLLKKTLVCEALAALLKTSAKVRKIARRENFLTTILEHINFIFESIDMTCTEYIRKYGESKKKIILRELKIVYNIILGWFCSDCLTNEGEIEKLSKMALQTWQWINHSEALREIFLKTLAVVSENSLQVCKQFATSITSFSNSIIQLTSKMIITETNKIRYPNLDFGILELGLGILSNCCVCIEGRLLLIKINLLDVISNLHPIDNKIQKSWNIVAIYWLEFWSTFSRYQEGGVVKHLYILCSLIAKTKSKIRMLCLEILRNMAFFQVNRPALLSSQDFQYTVRDILENGNEQEKFVIIGSLWKLSAENFKSRHIIKSWGVPARLKNIQREIDKDDVENDLNSAIEIVLNILK